MAKSKSKRNRYTPPAPKKAPPSPKWYGVMIIVLFAVGVLVIVTNYLGLLGESASNLFLGIGLLSIMVGFILALRLR